MAAGISTLLCVALLAVWVRSFSRGDELGFSACEPESRSDYAWSFTSELGSIQFGYRTSTYDHPDYGEPWLRQRMAHELSVFGFHGRAGYIPYRPRRMTWPRRLGFEFEVLRNHREPKIVPQSMNRYIVGVPHWLLAVPLGAVPALWTVRKHRQRARARRVRRGLCPACGYDLRASGGTCPECGRAVTRQPDLPARPAGT